MKNYWSFKMAKQSVCFLKFTSIVDYTVRSTKRICNPCVIYCFVDVVFQQAKKKQEILNKQFIGKI